MSTPSSSTLVSRAKTWARRWLGDVALLLVVVGMIIWIICIVASAMPEKPSWLLIPLTVVYAAFTLWMAAASFQNAAAARRSAEAMEASVEEQRQSRWAAYAAVLSFPEGFRYTVTAEGVVSVVLGNPYRQPMHRLWVRMWEVDRPESGAGLRYSTMKQSVPVDVGTESATVTIQLHPTPETESERVRVGNLALERYRNFFNGASPTGALCLVTYAHRAQFDEVVLVSSLVRVEVPS